MDCRSVGSLSVLIQVSTIPVLASYCQQTEYLFLSFFLKKEEKASVIQLFKFLEVNTGQWESGACVDDNTRNAFIHIATLS